MEPFTDDEDAGRIGADDGTAALAKGPAPGVNVLGGVGEDDFTGRGYFGLLVGLDRQAAARFSFLLSVPAIGMASAYELKNLVEAGEQVLWTDIVIGVGVSAVSAYLCIHYFLKLLDRIGMMPFVAYRLVLGAVLFAMFL